MKDQSKAPEDEDDGLESGDFRMWGLIKIMAPFAPRDYKEYTIIHTPKGPVILINPHVF